MKPSKQRAARTASTKIPQDERDQFAARLALALRAAGYGKHSPAMITREFNLRFPSHTITLHAARKWLGGGAIPTHARTQALASWLGVGPEWLRYDGDAKPEAATAAPPCTARERRFLRDYQRLDGPRQKLLEQFLHLILSVK
ncbi:MAG: hypothetical protein V4582_07085 [Pseudomonadota bacterium]